jgi:hypothetical protein
MWWTRQPQDFLVPHGAIVPERFCAEGQWPTNGGCRDLPGTSVPQWFSEGMVGVGAVDPATLADGAAIGGTLVGMGIRGVLGYFIGKWTGSSKGWTAAAAALLGVPGTAAAVYFTGTKTVSVRSNRKRKARRKVKKSCACNPCGGRR